MPKERHVSRTVYVVLFQLAREFFCEFTAYALLCSFSVSMARHVSVGLQAENERDMDIYRERWICDL